MRPPAVAALALAAGLAAAAPGDAAPQLVRIATATSPSTSPPAPGDPDRSLRRREGRAHPRPPRRRAAGRAVLPPSGLFADGEGGLLSIAFAPDYASSGLLYTYSSSSADLHIEIAEYRRSPPIPGASTRRAGVSLLRIPHPENTNHWGGQLQFGPDGFLYAGTGDGGGATIQPTTPRTSAACSASCCGSTLVRRAPYAIPPGNPFAGVTGARPEIWAYGLRNPWRFTFDRASGDLAIGDVGQGAWEEVDFAPRGTGAGAFYGWDAFEGTARLHRGAAAAGAAHAARARPAARGGRLLDHRRLRRARTGPAVSRRRYLHADFCTGVFRSGRAPAGRGSGDAPTRLALTNPSSFGEDLGVASTSSRWQAASSASPRAPRRSCRVRLRRHPRPPRRRRPLLRRPAPTPTAPETTIVRGPPARTSNRRVTIVATASEPAHFECSLDARLLRRVPVAVHDAAARRRDAPRRRPGDRRGRERRAAARHVGLARRSRPAASLGPRGAAPQLARAVGRGSRPRAARAACSGPRLRAAAVGSGSAPGRRQRARRGQPSHRARPCAHPAATRAHGPLRRRVAHTPGRAVDA